MKNQYRKARGVDIIKYACGGFGSNVPHLLVSGYLTFFYTDIFGISSVAVALLMLVSKVIDAVTDPLMGMLSDNTKTKLGKYRPWLLFGAPILGVFVALLFVAPDLSPTMKLVYAYVVYIAYSMASTATNIPYHALRSVMSEDPQQRTIITTFGTGFSLLAQIFTLVLTMPLVNLFGGGQRGWAMYAIFAAILMTVAFWMCAWGGKRYDKITPKMETQKFNLKQSVKVLTQNKPVLMLMIACGTDALANASGSAVNVYYYKYVLGREDLVAPTALALVIGSVLAFPCFPFVAKVLGKKWLHWVTSLLSIIPLGILLMNTTPSKPLLLFMTFLLGFVSRIPGVLAWAMLPECIDFGEWKCGVRGNGFLSSMLTFTNKFGGAIGAFLASFALSIFGFIANQEQPQAVLTLINFLKFGLPILGYIASLISMYFYDITEKRYAEIRKELDDRNETNA